jgi:trehalose 6-phosphate phosphatase
MGSSWPGIDLARACLVLDFDGTLAPIVEDPQTSTMPEATAAVLRRLAGRLGRLAVVSGRSAGFLLDRVGVDGVELVGLYGLDRAVDGVVEPDPRVAPHLPALEAARAALPDVLAAWPGAHLEDKGLALAVHWRRAADPAAAGLALPAAVRGLVGSGPAAGLAVEDGKMVVELRPPVDADKGTAVRRLAEGFDAVAYAGDDLGDLPAFAAARARGGLAIAVDHGAETDPQVLAAADLRVEGTDGLRAWLDEVARQPAR